MGLLAPLAAPAQGTGFQPNPQSVLQRGTSPLECWYSGAVNQSAYGTVAGVVDVIRAYPVVIGRAGIIDAIAFEVTTGGAAGAVGRAAVYRATSDRNLYPSSLVVDGGEKDCTGAAVKSTTGLSVYVRPGLYWFCQLQGVNASTSRRILAASLPSIFGMPSTLGANPNDILNVAFAYAAFPSTFPVGATLVTGSAARVVHVRFAS